MPEHPPDPAETPEEPSAPDDRVGVHVSVRVAGMDGRDDAPTDEEMRMLAVTLSNAMGGWHTWLTSRKARLWLPGDNLPDNRAARRRARYGPGIAAQIGDDYQPGTGRKL